MTVSELQTYIAKAQKEGVSKEALSIDLLQKGEKFEVIQRAFAAGQQPLEDTHTRTMFIVVYIGAFLVGAGVFSLIASNWQGIERMAKIAIILASMTAAYVLGWFLKEKKQLRKTGEALYFVGSICYGGGIFLTGQIFHIQADWPSGFILWLLGSIVMAVTSESRAIFYSTILLGIIATGGAPFTLTYGSVFQTSQAITTTALLFLAALVTLVSGLFLRKGMQKQSL